MCIFKPRGQQPPLSPVQSAPLSPSLSHSSCPIPRTPPPLISLPGAMWTLHKLNTRDTSRRGPSSICDPPARPSGPSSSRQTDTSVFPWEFPAADLERFPALRKRNFFCIQRHQARALHYDLRLQLDGGTLSWAIPKGLIGASSKLLGEGGAADLAGMDKKGESSRMAVQTTIHPISYTTHEGRSS